jgi:putative ABC transport system permease protein
MKDILQDLTYSLRTLRRSPRFTLVAVATLALGIGATTAIFSVVDSVLLKPLPYADQDRLTVLMERPKKLNVETVELSLPNFNDWRDQSHVFSRMAALTSNNYGLNLTGLRQPVHVEAAPVSSTFFTTLGVKPVLGRDFMPEEDRLGARHVVILGDSLWKELCGGDPHILGRQLRLDAESYTVVGIMPAWFHYPRGAAIWVPLVPFLGPHYAEHRIARLIKGLGRLKPGVTLAQASSEIEGIAARLEKQYKAANDGFSSSVRPLTDEVFGKSRSALLILLAGVLLLLLIAVANVANLLLARNLERRQEISVRAALGAGRRRLVRQLLSDGLVLSLLGGAGGLVVAALGVRLLTTLAPDDLPRLEEVHIDLTALLATGAILLLASAVFGLAPSLQRRRESLYEPLKESARRTSGGTGSARLRGFLVRAEVALAMLLLIGAGLLIQSVINLERTDPGFDPHNVLTARVRLPEKTYATAEQRQVFFERLVERARALPGVVNAATVLARPLDTSVTWEVRLWIEGISWEEAKRNPLLNLEAVSPGYFRTMGIKLVEGRPFDLHDDAKAPLVVILSKRAAEQAWPGQDPLGKRVRNQMEDIQTPWRTVIGVADDVHYRGWDDAMADCYVPARQFPFWDYISYQDLVLRTAAAPLTTAPAVRAAVYALDANQPVASILTLQRLVDRSQAGARFIVVLMATFGGLALCLAVVGIYGILSYNVEQRSHEMGIRMALGARQGEVVKMVLAQGLRLIASGLLIGLGAALLLTRFMVSLLYGVSVFDPLTFVAVPLVLVAVGMLATWVPAFRAAGSDPIKALRYG